MGLASQRYADLLCELDDAWIALAPEEQERVRMRLRTVRVRLRLAEEVCEAADSLRRSLPRTIGASGLSKSLAEALARWREAKP